MRCRILGLIVTLTLRVLVTPLAVDAQPPTHVHRIGYLSSNSTREQNPFLEAFLEGMRALGYVEGQNLVLEYRTAAGKFERLPSLAAELVRLHVDMLVAVGPEATLRAVLLCNSHSCCTAC